MLRPTIRFAARLGVPLVLAASLATGCAQTGPTAPDAGAGEPDARADDASATTPVVAEAPADPAFVEGYRLGQGDRIAIQVFDEPDLTMEATVGATGRIGYSYLGDLIVRDKTTDQIEREITELLSDGYLRNPSVNVGVVEYRPFFINGEVSAPGSYPYQPGLTLDRAIALAGGLTDRASTRKMFVMKAGDESEERRASMSTPIEPGDIVSIQEGFF